MFSTAIVLSSDKIGSIAGLLCAAGFARIYIDLVREYSITAWSTFIFRLQCAKLCRSQSRSRSGSMVFF